ncbi:MAG: VWA domain-containing protein [candidate division KSB1 bacterium]|nr:VWA domain-containing protein [candidate division KSB1 bacterium]MDQ7065798.1 VWA domain-containing protein [candidate division KSB1 bacterium]
MIHFANPQFLILLVFLPVLGVWYWKRQTRRTATLRYSNTGLFLKVKQPRSQKWRHSVFVLRMLALALAIVALARPQAGHTEEEIITEGIDIVLTLDISSSMLAEDFRPLNRLEAAKQVAEKFIKGRQTDRIGMVVFAGKSFTQCPLTLDYGIVINFLNDIRVGLIEDGTAIGLAIANAVNRLRHSEAKSKVVILLTDGRNNRGEIDPVTAAKVAKAMDVRIYTIGVGTRGQALYPINDPIFGKRYVRMPVDIDEDMLKQVASITGGKYFRATDQESLEKIFEEIDRLEKTKIEVKEYTRYTELFMNWMWVALAALVLEMVLANTRFRKLP